MLIVLIGAPDIDPPAANLPANRSSGKSEPEGKEVAVGVARELRQAAGLDEPSTSGSEAPNRVDDLRHELRELYESN